MHRLGTWAAQGLGKLRRIELGRHRIAAAVGISAAVILVSSVIEAIATAAFYGSLAVAVVYVVLQWVQKPGGTV